jgi:SAM-dependent methyltransferase
MRPFTAPLRLLEAGAGDGAFLRLLRTEVGSALQATALEYDRGALAKLKASGFTARKGSVVDFASDGRVAGAFDVVCMFQTLEHMEAPAAVLAAVDRLLSARGSLFVSVPNGDAVVVQERLTGFYDMPPNHIGRWVHSSFEAWVCGSAFAVQASEAEPADRDALIDGYVAQRLMADRYRRNAWPSLVDRLRHPIAIDLLTARRRRRYRAMGERLATTLPSPTYWVHLVKAAAVPVGV